MTAEKYAAAQACSCNGGGLYTSISVSPNISHVGDTVTISQIGVALADLNNCYVTNGIAYVMYPNGASALVAGPPTGNGKNGIQIYENHFNMLGATPLNPCAGPDQVQCLPTVIGIEAGCVTFTTTYQIDAADVGRQLGPATTPNPRPDGLAGGQSVFFQLGVPKKVHFVAACDGFIQGGVPEGGSGSSEITIISPAIAVTKQCVSNCAPPLSGAAAYGQPISFTGFVTNTGDTVLTNVTVVDTPAATITFATTSRLGNPFPAAGPGSLIAGDSVAYVGSYQPTANLCGPFTDTVVASGTDLAPAAKTVTATNSATCTVCASPSITVTKQCPATNAVPGSLLIFSGTVCNNGNVPLTNVTVVDNQTLSGGGNLVASYPLLTNGECRNFTGSMVVPMNVCSITDILTARGTNICTGQGVSASVTTNCASPYCITQVAANGNKLTFSFTTQSGHTNIVQYTELLNPPNWQVLTNVIGNGSTVTVFDMITNSQRFYRVLSQ